MNATRNDLFLGRLRELLDDALRDEVLPPPANFTPTETPDAFTASMSTDESFCKDIVDDFLFLADAGPVLESFQLELAAPGSLIRWLYSKQEVYSEARRQLFERHLPRARGVWRGLPGAKVHCLLGAKNARCNVGIFGLG